jgi:hypothetical protein
VQPSLLARDVSDSSQGETLRVPDGRMPRKGPSMKGLVVPALGLLLVACAAERPVRMRPPEPRIVTPATPELARLSGRWVGRAETAEEVRWLNGFTGHAPPLRVDVETVTTDGMQTLILIDDNWVQMFLYAKASPEQGVYEAQMQEGPSLYWVRVRLVSQGVLGFELERNVPQPAGVLSRRGCTVPSAATRIGRGENGLVLSLVSRGPL